MLFYAKRDNFHYYQSVKKKKNQSKPITLPKRSAAPPRPKTIISTHFRLRASTSSPVRFSPQPNNSTASSDSVQSTGPPRFASAQRSAAVATDAPIEMTVFAASSGSSINALRRPSFVETNPSGEDVIVCLDDSDEPDDDVRAEGEEDEDDDVSCRRRRSRRRRHRGSSSSHRLPSSEEVTPLMRKQQPMLSGTMLDHVVNICKFLFE